MTFSGKMIILMYSNSSILFSISFIGLDRDFFSMAQIPTMTCLPAEHLGVQGVASNFAPKDDERLGEDGLNMLPSSYPQPEVTKQSSDSFWNDTGIRP